MPVHPAVAGDRPLVFAHRGGGALAPENTIPAFDNGLALGADGLELDVHLSRDGVLVVHHDLVLDRTTNARGAVVSLTAEELARVDAGFRFGAQDGYPFRGRPIGVPTLREVLERYPGVRLIIEIKVNTAEIARAVVDEVHRAGATGRVCIGSFGTLVLREVRRLDPEMATSAGREEVRRVLYGSWIGLRPRTLPNQAYQVPERAGATRVVSPRFIRIAHAAGAVVQVWTVDREEDMRRLLDWGVDALITNRPDIAVPVVRDWVGHRPR
ncbi:MAG TPA: glycerophosphodiester phosphodiesterase [Vicinamibacterales bacterium]|jgi:glycerophosphoryl diester phosphodiesterase